MEKNRELMNEWGFTASIREIASVEKGGRPLDAKRGINLVEATATREEKESILMSVVDNIPESLVVIDRNYKLVSANKSFLENLLHFKGILIRPGEDIFKLQSATQHFDKWLCNFKKALSGEQFKIEASFVQNEKEYHREAHFGPVRHQGEIIGATFYLKDVTHAMLNVERQASIINSLNDHIALLDENGVILAVNDAWKRFADENGMIYENYGIGANYLTLCKDVCGQDESDGQAMAKGIADVLERRQQVFSMEYNCHSPNKKRWFNAVVTPLSKEYNKGVVVAHLNITPHKEAEIQIEFDRKNRDALINSTEDLMWSIDKDMKLITANQSFSKIIKYLTGWEPEAGMFLLNPNAFEESEIENWRKRYTRVLSGEMYSEEIFREHPVRMWFEMSYYPILEKGKVIGAACYAKNITARKLVEESLRLSNERYEWATKATNDAIWDWDLLTDAAYWSEGYEKLFGYVRDQQNCNSGAWISHIHPEDKERVFESIKKEIESDAPNYWQSEYRYIKADSTVAYVFDRGYIVCDETGKPFRMVGAMQDITARKMAEDALLEKTFHLNERIKELNCLYRSTVILNDSNLHTDEILQACVNIIPSGYQDPTLICARISLFDKEFRTANFKETAWKQEAGISIKGKSAGTIEVFLTGNAQSDPCVPFLNEELSLINSLAGNLAGSVERKMAEESLQKSEANIRTILEQTNQCYILLDLNFNMLTFNSMANHWAKLAFGCELKEGGCLVSMVSDEKKASTYLLFEMVLGGNIVENESSYSMMDGSVQWFHTRNIPVRNEKGEVIGLCIMAKDFTKRNKYELEREKMIAEIIQRNKDLEQFAYIISHNLRAPVANIIGFTDFLINEDLDKLEMDEVLDGLKVSIKNLDNIIKDLNNILQTKQALAENKEKVNFSDLVNGIQISISQLILKEKATILFDFTEVNEIISLKSYLHSIFYNLISNSIKYKQPGKPLVISITSKKCEQGIELIFKDNGLGIDLERKGNQLFGLYKRFHPQVAEGKGMGLFMVRSQVESLGGMISVSSEVGMGTEFKIVFQM